MAEFVDDEDDGDPQQIGHKSTLEHKQKALQTSTRKESFEHASMLPV